MAYYVGAPLSAGLFEGMFTDPNNDPSGFLGESPSSTVNASVFNDPFGMSHHQALHQFTSSLTAPTLQSSSAAIPASILSSLAPLTNLGELQRQQQAEIASPSGADTPTTANDLSKSRYKELKKGTKRPRPTLSCTECVRRKSKCDRTVPCATCIKRGTPERCRVDDEEQRPLQPFAQARELEAVQDRVQRLEQLLLHIAPDQAKRFLDENAVVEATPAAPRTAALASTRPNSIDDEDEAGEEGGEAEKAAFALESIAVAGRGHASAGADPPESLESLPLTAQARIRENQLRRQEIDFLMSMLPDWAIARSLVMAFFEKCTWQHHVVHVPTYEAQLSALKELIQQGRITEIDPAWLSLHFMVLACGLFFSPNRKDITGINQMEYTNTWVLCAQRALTVADWSGRPQLTCIQSVVLFPTILMHTGGIKRLASWIAAALRMAQLLDLHKLDDRVPVSKLGAAANLTSVEREIGKRVYFALTHGEVNFASRWLGLDQSASASQAQIPNLLNVDDNDLLVSSPVSKPIEVATASSFQVLRARIMLADISARLTGSDAKVHKYETVLAFDQRTRQLLESLPPYFRYDRADDVEIKSIVSERPYIAYQRCVILYGLNNRLLRAHRPFMTRGYTDSKYGYSTASCIRASKVIIAAQRALREIFDAADRMYNCLLYCFSSAVVLLVDNFHRLSSTGEVEDTEDLDAQRREAFDVLLMLRRESNTSTIAAASAKVLEGLLNEEDSRRQQRGLPAAITTLSRAQTPDLAGPSLREAVDRIAGVVNGAAGPSGNIDLSASSDKIMPASKFPNAASSNQPSLNVPPSAADLGITIAPGTQSFVGLGNANTLSQEESEELLRSLGFFEVTANGIPSFASQEAGDTMFAGGSLPQQVGWLDGFGEW